MKVFCKDCKHWKSKEYSVSVAFVEPERHSRDGGPPSFPSFDLVSEGGSIPMCHHPSCFSRGQKVSPERKSIEVERIQGQAQLNHDNTCLFFVPTFWYRVKLFLRSLFMREQPDGRFGLRE